jgi:hypothetical protein
MIFSLFLLGIILTKEKISSLNHPIKSMLLINQAEGAYAIVQIEHLL